MHHQCALPFTESQQDCQSWPQGVYNSKHVLTAWEAVGHLNAWLLLQSETRALLKIKYIIFPWMRTNLCPIWYYGLAPPLSAMEQTEAIIQDWTPFNAFPFWSLFQLRTGIQMPPKGISIIPFWNPAVTVLKTFCMWNPNYLEQVTPYEGCCQVCSINKETKALVHQWLIFTKRAFTAGQPNPELL